MPRLRTLHATLAGLVLVTLVSMAPAQDLAGTALENEQSESETFEQLPFDELAIRLSPLQLEELEALHDEVFAEVRALATELSTEIWQRMRLQRAAEPDTVAIAQAETRIESLQVRESELLSRTNILLDAIEQKGGDVSATRAYLGAIENLDTDEAASSKTPDAIDPTESVRTRANELIAIIRAEPPAHERQVPWDVPLSEFELELQPLAVDAILPRLDKWREMLQREVRKRVRIDILLNDAKKLEETRARRAATAPGGPGAAIALDAIKTELAEQSQEQQRIINAIVKRMEIAIRLVERRGGDANQYADYIAAATGQKLNLTDLPILKAQLMAWLRSPEGGVLIGFNLLKFLGVVLAFWIVSRIIGGVIGAGVRRMPRASSLLGPVLVGASRKIILFIGLVIGVSMLGVNIGPLLAMIGAAGLVIGLALQGTLSNFASGILILLNRPYDVGDVINAGGVFGKVEAMNLVSTSILTFDNQQMLVPNNQIWSDVITNVTGKTTRRVDLTFGIGYADDMDKAIGIIREAIEAHSAVLKDPAPTIRVHELGDNSVNIIARPWTKTSTYWDVYWDLVHDVKKRFDAQGINIPFPQRDLNFPGPIEIKWADGAERRALPDDEHATT